MAKNVHPYFAKSPSDWKFEEFLTHCEGSTRSKKVDAWIKSLRALAQKGGLEGNRAGVLLGQYKSASVPYLRHSV
jgi:hypothetical protein